MKKLFGLLTVLLFAVCAQAVPLKEGEHYEVINQQSTAKPEVKEFFSYYCPHCFAFEPLAERLKAKAKSITSSFEKVMSTSYVPPVLKLWKC